MNLVDCYVTEILSASEFVTMEDVSWWQRKVKYNSYGVIGETVLTFNSKEEADKIKIGHHFLA